MESSLNQIHAFFRASQHYFWCWAEDGDIVEWQNGDTLCYRDDLSYMLSAVAEEGLPPLGTILLLLGACQERSLDDAEQSLNNCINKMAMEAQMRETLMGFKTQAFEFLEIIQSLPSSLRKEHNRIHLLNTLITRLPNKIPAPKAQDIAATLQHGRWDHLFIRNELRVHIKTITTDLENLCYLYSWIPGKEDLEYLLETGVKKVPPPSPVEEEEIPLDLLAVLAEDPRTVGLSRLSKRLLAAIHIPMRTTGASDLPLGGVSDITNRGDFDRLLISELAQDQDVLSARLVNNEALYLRREEPPDQTIRERVVLIDQTIRMWGIPRVFSISAALALGQKKKGIAEQSVYGLAGSLAEKLDFNTQKGVLSALKQLHPHLHCGEALEDIQQSLYEKGYQREIIFITEEEAFHQAAFQAHFNRIKHSISFVLLVSRTGDFWFYQYLKSNRKLLSQAQVDLNKLLFARSAKPILSPKRSGKLPYALRLEAFPLGFPALQFNYRREYTFMIPDEKGVLCITPDHRALLWGGKDWEPGHAAKEILTHIEYGDYHFGYESPSTVFILVRQANSIQLYTLKLEEDTVQKHTLTLDTINSFFNVVYKDGHFKLFNFNEDYQIDPVAGTLEKLDLPYQQKGIFKGLITHANQYKHSAALIKPMTNSGYSILTRVKRIYINEHGNLCLNNWQITLVQQTLRLEKVEPRLAGFQAPRISQGKRLVQENPNILFGVKEWQDGSKAFVDSRGLLHLKSSDPKIPEICLVVAINIPLPCWASNGTYTGSRAFIPKQEQHSIVPAKQFYQETLKKFIEKLK
ncbi:MAG: hypothetical protein HRU41_09245 [Saprospiraceae bacterium]|nr:hypothetical protein [Saprospiraceae bacterium]